MVITPVRNISNEVGLVKSVLTLFLFLSHTLSQLCSPRCFRASAAPQFSGCFFPVQPTARFVSLHRLGVVHQTSLRSRAPMRMYSNSPQFGEAGSLFTYPVTLLQDHCCDQASLHGHYRFSRRAF